MLGRGGGHDHWLARPDFHSFDAIEEAPEPPRATGQYPDPVWANTDYSAAAQELLGGDNLDDAPEAPRATGQYPDPVWANGDYSAAAQSMTTASATTLDATNAFVSFKALNYAHEIGVTSDPEQPAAAAAEVPLDYQEMYNIIRAVATADSGDTPYTVVAADREFTTLGQPAYQQRHFGLAFGLVLFTQESGLLGTLLTIMHRRDSVLFANIFGAQAEALLATTNAPTAEQRLQPVEGELVWSPTWTARFERAGAEPVFQAAQNETAIEHQFRPMLNVAFGLGFTSDRGLAMVFDRVVTEGLGTGLRWVVQAAGALRTAAQRAHALHVLGYTNLAAFQATTGWTPQDGNFGPETHAALVGALRQQGGATLPTGRELMARLVTAATGPALQRLMRLQDSSNFDGIVYRLQ